MPDIQRFKYFESIDDPRYDNRSCNESHWYDAVLRFFLLR